jgi:hypothetical protein
MCAWRGRQLIGLWFVLLYCLPWWWWWWPPPKHIEIYLDCKVQYVYSVRSICVQLFDRLAWFKQRCEIHYAWLSRKVYGTRKCIEHETCFLIPSASLALNISAHISLISSSDSVVGIAASYRLGSQGFDSRQEQEILLFSKSVHTSSGSPPTLLFSGLLRSSPRVKQLGHEVYPTLPSSNEDKNERKHTSPTSIFLHGVGRHSFIKSQMTIFKGRIILKNNKISSTKLHENPISHCRVKDSSLLWCDVAFGEWVLTFRKIVMPSSSWIKTSSWTTQPLKTVVQRRATHPQAQRYIPEDLNPPPQKTAPWEPEV